MRFAQSSTITKVLFAAVTMLTFLPSSAMAEDASGKFTIKHPVRWGAVVLPAGDYTYKLEHHASDLLLVRASGGQPGFLVMANSISTMDTLQPDRLVLQRSGSEWYVSAILLSSIGETLHFVTAAHTEMAAATGQNGLASLSKP
jgi:hypothetical protein